MRVPLRLPLLSTDVAMLPPSRVAPRWPSGTGPCTAAAAAAAAALVVCHLATVMVYDLATVAVVHGPRSTRTSDPTAWEGASQEVWDPMLAMTAFAFYRPWARREKLYKPTSCLCERCWFVWSFMLLREVDGVGRWLCVRVGCCAGLVVDGEAIVCKGQCCCCCFWWWCGGRRWWR